MSVDQKRAFNKLKHDLESWRELILLGSEILKWDKQFYPIVIFGSLSTLFLILWYLDHSTLTIVCLLLLTIILFDYFYPILSKFIFKPDNWTGAQENKFEEVCTELCTIKMKLNSFYEMVFAAKEEKSTMFVIAMTCALVFGAYIGSVIDNLLLTYFTTLFIAFLPGLQKHGLISKIKNQFGGIISKKIQEIREKNVKHD